MELQVERIDSDGPRLRIAVVTETYPPEVNGVALSLSRLVTALAQRHSIELVRLRQPTDSHLLGPSSSSGEILMRGVPIPRYPGLRMGLPCKKALIKRWSHHRPDIVHIATEGPLGWSALRAAQQLKLPVSSEFRTNFHAYSQHYGLGLLTRSIMMVLRRFHNLTDLTMVPTAALRNELAATGFKSLSVVGRGVDLDRFGPEHRRAELRRQWGLKDDNGLAVVCVGRLAAEKNLALAAQAFEAVSAVHAHSRLVFVGDGPQRAALQAAYPNAVFTGMLTGSSLSEAVASADLFVFPSLTETFGNVVTEAMASGVPVLAYRMAAAAELIEDGVNGMTAPSGDARAFVEAASRLAADRDLLRSMGAQARHTASRLSWAGIAQQVEGEMLRLIERREVQMLPSFSAPTSSAVPS